MSAEALGRWSLLVSFLGNFMIKLKKLAALIGVIGLVAAAPAAMAGGGPVSLTPIGPLSWTGSFNQTYGSLTAFVDDWTFMLPGGPAGQASGSAIASFNPGTGALTSFFTLAEFVDVTTSTVLATTGPTLGFYDVKFTLPLALNATDTYAFRLHGTTLGSGGSYGGTVSVTAVPEPESYALFLAGLGLLGLIVRRRSSDFV